MEFLTSLPFFGFVQSAGWSLLIFILVLGVLVTIHEFGHYLAARSVGIRVLAFSVGFGPEIFGWTDKHGTRWKVSWIPLGGYVSMYGFEETDMLHKAKDAHQAYCNKSVLARMWAVFAGPLMNFILAYVLLAALFMGGEESLQPRVGALVPNMPAVEAGMQPGDLIVQVNGIEIKDFMHLSKVIGSESGALDIAVERNGTLEHIVITPQQTTEADALGAERKVGRIGVQPDYESVVKINYNPLEALGVAGVRTWEMISLTGRAFKRLITREMGTENLAGPISIAQTAGEMAGHGLYPLIAFMALISVNLGILNLLPIPVLDGGHLLFLAIEGLRGGKKLSEKYEGYAYRAGLLVLGALMFVAVYNDLARLVVQLVGAS